MLKILIFAAAVFSSSLFVSAAEKSAHADGDRIEQEILNLTPSEKPFTPLSTSEVPSEVSTTTTIESKLEEIPQTENIKKQPLALSDKSPFFDLLPKEVLERLLSYLEDYPSLVLVNRRTRDIVFYYGLWVPWAISKYTLMSVIPLLQMEDRRRQIAEESRKASQNGQLAIEAAPKCSTDLIRHEDDQHQTEVSSQQPGKDSQIIINSSLPYSSDPIHRYLLLYLQRRGPFTWLADVCAKRLVIALIYSVLGNGVWKYLTLEINENFSKQSEEYIDVALKSLTAFLQKDNASLAQFMTENRKKIIRDNVPLKSLPSNESSNEDYFRAFRNFATANGENISSMDPEVRSKFLAAFFKDAVEGVRIDEKLISPTNYKDLIMMVLESNSSNAKDYAKDRYINLAVSSLEAAPRKDHIGFAQFLTENREDILAYPNVLYHFTKKAMLRAFCMIAMGMNNTMDPETRFSFLDKMAAFLYKEADFAYVARLSRDTLTPGASIKSLAQWYNSEEIEAVRKAWLDAAGHSEYASAAIYHSDEDFLPDLAPPEELCADVLLKNSLSQKHEFSREDRVRLLQDHHALQSLLEIIAKYDNLEDIDRSIIVELSNVPVYGVLDDVSGIITLLSIDPSDEILDRAQDVLKNKLDRQHIAQIVIGVGFATHLTVAKKEQIFRLNNKCSECVLFLNDPGMDFLKDSRPERLIAMVSWIQKKETFWRGSCGSFMKALSEGDLRALVLRALSKKDKPLLELICDDCKLAAMPIILDIVNGGDISKVVQLYELPIFSSVFQSANRIHRECPLKNLYPAAMEMAMAHIPMSSRDDYIRAWEIIYDVRRLQQIRSEKMAEERAVAKLLKKALNAPKKIRPVYRKK